jgi:hypothetical protein
VGVEYMFAENSDDFFCHNEECRQQHPGMWLHQTLSVSWLCLLFTMFRTHKLTDTQASLRQSGCHDARNVFSFFIPHSFLAKYTQRLRGEEICLGSGVWYRQ